MVPVFNLYLRIFQWESPLVHVLHGEMHRLLMTRMKRFIKENVVEKCERSKDLLNLNINDADNQLPLKKIDFGSKALKHLTKISNEKKRLECLEIMKKSYISMTNFVKKKLPLKVPLLVYLRCLDPARRKETQIEKLAEMLPHVVQEREVSLVNEQFKLFQSEDIPDE